MPTGIKLKDKSRDLNYGCQPEINEDKSRDLNYLQYKQYKN
jgi:hypothetical protein